MEPLKQKKLKEESEILFLQLNGRKPKPTDKETLTTLEKAIQHGYKLGFDKFYMELCEKCNFNRATCFEPGAYCADCADSMEEDDE